MPGTYPLNPMTSYPYTTPPYGYLPGYSPYSSPYTSPYSYPYTTSPYSSYIPGITPYVSPFVNPYSYVSPYATVNPLTALLSNPFVPTPTIPPSPFLTYAAWRNMLMPTYSSGISALTPFTSPFFGMYGR
jgi:hypothetical protein